MRRRLYSAVGAALALSALPGCTAVLGLEELTVDRRDGGGGGAPSASAAIDASAAAVGGSGGSGNGGGGGLGGNTGCADPVGEPVLIADGEVLPTRIAVADGKVYWTTYDDFAHLRSAPACSSAAGNAFEERLGFSADGGVAAAGTVVCWGKSDGPSQSALECSTDGGKTWNANSTPGSVQAWGVAIQGGQVYWTDFNHAYVAPVANPNQTVDLNAMSSPVDHILGIAPASPAAVYWLNLQSPAVIKHDLTNGDLSTVANIDGAPKNIAVDSTNVYWTDLMTEEIGVVPRTGGLKDTFAGGENRPFDVAVDDTHVYWTNSGTTSPNGSVKRKLKDSLQVPEDIAMGQSTPWGIALDAEAVYWTEQASGKVWKWIKPR